MVCGLFQRLIGMHGKKGYNHRFYRATVPRVLYFGGQCRNNCYSFCRQFLIPSNSKFCLPATRIGPRSDPTLPLARLGTPLGIRTIRDDHDFGFESCPQTYRFYALPYPSI
jgi:hypothetical protein